MIQTNLVLDAIGLACPMPIVKTKKAMKDLESGEVLEIQATDKGSTADLKAWAERTGHQYLGTLEKESVLKHYLRKASDEEKEEMKHPHVIQNEELQQKLKENHNAVVLDVRESAEYAFNHIPNAKSVPLGELEEFINEFDKESEIYVVCRTGNRSDLASQKLTEVGFTKVFNVVPGMTMWTGPTEKSVN
ncbi:sulfurtransferase TusA family protein [Sporosarcina sp. 6E9]|uniref:sulfurtransferase TusA family protein n=1 Tax=Sporosarcina sp. 6E9 TaxID=2819235 RepID=UPI001B30FEA6|nr:sulfurtransferase TusA family protein [Sporosarcina sp. 6E9]